jgi:hypothetical protein
MIVLTACSDKIGASSSEFEESSKMENLDALLVSDNLNDSIIEIDDFISQLCEYGDSLDKLTEPQKNFYFNQSLEREVNSGGFNGYFYSSSGRYAHETVESLKLIGANNFAAILQKAVDKFPDKTVPQDDEARQDILEEIESETWQKIDEEFYEYPDNLNQLNIDYIIKNKDSF